MSDAKYWWQEQPLTISAVQCHLKDTDEYVLDEYVSKQHFNTEQLLLLVAQGYMGYYSEKLHGEKLDAYLKKSRVYGVREIVYHNTHCIGNEIAAEHPDWLQFRKDDGAAQKYPRLREDRPRVLRHHLPQDGRAAVRAAFRARSG